uniref:Uncharacterized protein n=1 Tax=Ditylenchus dipsaci TaxID=166011 RepID=A0A915EIU4_9BILA
MHVLSLMRLLLNYEFKSDAIAACVQEYSDTDLANYLYEDAIYFAPHYNFATRSTFVGAKAYLYQFEYDKIGTGLFVRSKFRQFHTNRPAATVPILRDYFKFISTGNPNGIETRGFEVFNPAELNFFKMDFALDDNASCQMNRVGGPTSPLTDELLVDDLMTSLYIDGDLEQIKSIFVPWSSNGYKLSLCQVLFYVGTTPALILHMWFTSINNNKKNFFTLIDHFAATHLYLLNQDLNITFPLV